jgi:hypothetical protein
VLGNTGHLSAATQLNSVGGQSANIDTQESNPYAIASEPSLGVFAKSMEKLDKVSSAGEAIRQFQSGLFVRIRAQCDQLVNKNEWTRQKFSQRYRDRKVPAGSMHVDCRLYICTLF